MLERLWISAIVAQCPVYCCRWQRNPGIWILLLSLGLHTRFVCIGDDHQYLGMAGTSSLSFLCLPAKQVTISSMSSWEWATKAVSSVNMSSRTSCRMGFVLVVDLNWFALNKFAPSLDCIVTPLSQPANEQSRTLERKREKRVGARTQPCFTPFCTLKGLESSPFRFTEAFVSLCREAMRSTNRSGQPIFRSIFQSCGGVKHHRACRLAVVL